MNETHILIRLLWMYIPRNWEFGSALAKLRNFEGFEPLKLPLGTPPEYRYSSTISLTSAPDGRWVVNATPRPFYPRE
jgi:hypothetical protein